MQNLLNKILDINFFAQYCLSSRIQKRGKFVCRGQVQMCLAPDVIIKLPQKTCYIGIPLLGAATPRNATTVITGGSKATIALNGAYVGRGVILSVGPSAHLTVESNSYISDGSRIAAENSIAIGKNCAVSWGVTIIDDDGHGFGSPPYSAPVVIEDSVWIGCHVIVLKGVTIGKGSVVAAGSVVNRSCPPNSLLAGVPARVIREEVFWTDKMRMENQSIEMLSSD